MIISDKDNLPEFFLILLYENDAKNGSICTLCGHNKVSVDLHLSYFICKTKVDRLFQQKSVVNNVHIHEAEAVKLKRDSCTQTRKFCRLFHQSGVELSWFHSEQDLPRFTEMNRCCSFNVLLALSTHIFESSNNLRNFVFTCRPKQYF